MLGFLLNTWSLAGRRGRGDCWATRVGFLGLFILMVWLDISYAEADVLI